MLSRLGTMGVAAVVSFALTAMLCASASASQDTAATHTYLTSGYRTLNTAIASIDRIAQNVGKLNRRFHGECPLVGAGSPQNEEAQELAYEVFGALEATGFDTDASAVESFVHTVMRLHWSNATVTRDAHQFATSMQELVDLSVPDLCGDVRAWSATGWVKASAATIAFDKHVEDIEGAPVPWKLLARYTAPGDRALSSRDQRLYTKLTNLETTRGQDWWNETLETLALNQ